jgi:hypothetical protein
MMCCILVYLCKSNDCILDYLKTILFACDKENVTTILKVNKIGSAHVNIISKFGIEF